MNREDEKDRDLTTGMEDDTDMPREEGQGTRLSDTDEQDDTAM